MSEPIVRKAKYGDEEGIHLAHMNSIKTVCSNDYSLEQINAWGGREYNYESKKNLIKNHHVWVVEMDGTIEGYGLLFIDKDSNIVEIGALYFTPKVLGKGLGKEIVKQMKTTAISLSFKEIFLISTKTSKNFYEKQGFIQYKKDEASPIGGVPIEGHPMKLML